MMSPKQAERANRDAEDNWLAETKIKRPRYAEWYEQRRADGLSTDTFELAEDLFAESARWRERAIDALELLEKRCRWTLDPNPDCEVWETACSNGWQFIEGGPAENGMRFCCYCGGILEEDIPEPRDE